MPAGCSDMAIGSGRGRQQGLIVTPFFCNSSNGHAMAPATLSIFFDLFPDY